MQQQSYVCVLVTAWITAVLTIGGMKGYEYMEPLIADRITAQETQETAEQIATLKRNAARREALARAATREAFLEGVDPQDAFIWITMLPRAELDEHCSALPECTQSSMHIARPITAQVRSPMDDAVFIAVLGIEVWAPSGYHEVTPRSTYYVGSQQGGLWRMESGTTTARVRNLHIEEWRPVSQSASDDMLGEVRIAFITEWQRRLADPGGQKL